MRTFNHLRLKLKRNIISLEVVNQKAEAIMVYYNGCEIC